MKKYEECMKKYEQKFGEPFPKSYFDYMHDELKFEDFGVNDMVQEISRCISSNRKYDSHKGNIGYELYLVELDYFAKFGTRDVGFRGYFPDLIKKLKQAIEDGVPLDYDENAVY